MLRIGLLTTVLLLNLPALVCADTGDTVEPATLWTAWNFDLLVLFNLSLLGWFYGRGVQRLWRKAGIGRGVSRGQTIAFFASFIAVMAALLSPLDALSAELASAHMVQHMLLMVVAAPLFAIATPGLVLTWGLARRWRSSLGNLRRLLDADFLRRPLLPWLLYASSLWIWHLPVFYEAALSDPLLHDAQHLSFFVSASLFWRALLVPLHRIHRHPEQALISLFSTWLHATLLGIFMTLSPAVWYEVYAGRTEVWGLTPHEDQQLAGLIMWMPSCLIFPAVAAVGFGQWLTANAARDSRSCLQPLRGTE